MWMGNMLIVIVKYDSLLNKHSWALIQARVQKNELAHSGQTETDLWMVQSLFLLLRGGMKCLAHETSTYPMYWAVSLCKIKVCGVNVAVNIYACAYHVCYVTCIIVSI